MLEATRAYARERGVAPAANEFQMLYGIRRDLQAALVREGFRVRVYVPFGREWFAYFIPALMIGLPILVWMLPPQNTSMCGTSPSLGGFCIVPGWLAPTDWQRYIWL